MTYNNLDELRAERNSRLAAYDYYFLTDITVKTSDITLAAIAVYRQALRDLPARYEEDDVITDVDWPEYPQIISQL
tara:strand:+ start:38 stop:265 length:228 start_codon:yes stop_codon:yes gene_type:complete